MRLGDKGGEGYARRMGGGERGNSLFSSRVLALLAIPADSRGFLPQSIADIPGKNTNAIRSILVIVRALGSQVHYCKAKTSEHTPANSVLIPGWLCG